MKEAILALLKSKRVSAIIIGGLATVVIKYLKMEPETAQQASQYVFYMVIAFVGGQSLTDALSGGKTSHSAPKADASKEE